MWDLAAALLGVLAFVYFCAPEILRPSEIGWLLSRTDPAQHFLSWQFFRATPLVQFPLGLNLRFGSELQSSIVFSDSLPLLALPLKYARSILPPVFQYHGMWILACLAAQGVAARRLLGRFVADRLQQVLGAAFFVLSPSLLFRLEGHFSLLAHWILLAGFGLYFSVGYRRRSWLALLGVSALVHAYLLVLAVAIWITDLVGRSSERDIRWRSAILEAGAGAALVAGTMLAAGYFVSGSSVAAAQGFGEYRMNVLSPLVPHRGWSLIVPSRAAVGRGEYEGFNYLGTGILLVAAFVLAAWRRRTRGADRVSRPIAPLVWLGGACTVYALSTRVYWGATELWTYDLPPALASFASTFRASGRMFWPVVYLLDLAVLVGLSRRLGRRQAAAVLAVALALQVVDLGEAAGRDRRRFAQGSTWKSPLESPFWDAAAKRYRKIEIVPPANDPEGFVAWSHLAALHGMTINSGYYARFDGLRVRRAARRQAAELDRGQFDPEALYVFERREGVWRSLHSARDAPGFVGEIDGFAIFAPEFGPVDRSWLEPKAPARNRRRRKGGRGG